MGIKEKFKSVMKEAFPNEKWISDDQLRNAITIFTIGWVEGLHEGGLARKAGVDLLAIKETREPEFDPAEWRFW